MTEQVEKSTPQISVADLANVVNVIDFAAKNGAFTGPDIEFVGKLRNKIQAFVESVTPKDEEKEVTETKKSETKEPKAKRSARKK